MDELVSQLESEDLIALCGLFLGLVAILGGISIGLVAVIAHHFRRSRMEDIEATLKMEMLERGMSAAEISQVLDARAAKAERACPSPFFGFRDLRHVRREPVKS